MKRITTRLRLADDTTIEITMEQDEGRCNWTPITIDGKPAQWWIDAKREDVSSSKRTSTKENNDCDKSFHR
jgi:hypothetical protein